MRFTRSIKLRLRLVQKGHRALGEFYRPILSSIHTSGAHIQVEIDPVLKMLDLAQGPTQTQPVPSLDYSARLFPDLYNSDDLTREAIWRIILALKPEVVVETGVANGLSTQVILSALKKNGQGHLYSFDIDPRVEESVPVNLRERWSFTLLEERSAMSELEATVLPFGDKIGVWFHDSDHNYSWQRFEFDLAARLLKPGGVLISDDADGTEAFANFCKEHPEWLNSALFDIRKVCGFSRKPNTS